MIGLFSTVASFGLVGIKPYIVSVEVDSRRGMPGFDIVGLPDATVRESRDRVKSALQNMGYKLPETKIIANLAPADTRKQGSVYDLPILLALISACGYERLNFEDTAVVGEIGLSGDLRPVAGVLPMVLDAAKLGFKRVIVPEQNAAEAAVATGVDIFCATHASRVVAFLNGSGTLPRAGEIPRAKQTAAPLPDLSDVKGQREARRALEIAAAGGHNILLIGPPGTGKSMLARRIPSILPPMTETEAVEATKIYSVAGMLPPGISLLEERPFRAPHHTVSAASITGGGPHPRPGEISLAHAGVLFLDELPEFQKIALEVLRQPLEDGEVSISRVRQRLTYPSRVLLAAAMNPCPCGFYGHPSKECTCSRNAIERYMGKISGPLLDRIDIHVEVLPVDYEQISDSRPQECSADVRIRVSRAREIQVKRFAGTGVACNAQMPPTLIDKLCVPEPDAQALLRRAFDSMGLSARGYHRILKVARTIADLDGSENIRSTHVSQAVQFRNLDRKYWGGGEASSKKHTAR